MFRAMFPIKQMGLKKAGVEYASRPLNASHSKIFDCWKDKVITKDGAVIIDDFEALKISSSGSVGKESMNRDRSEETRIGLSKNI